MSTASAFRQSVGSLQEAEATARRAEAAVPAYGKFLTEQGFAAGGPFAERPLTDKQGYITAYPLAERLGDDHEQAFTIFRSSGSSGRSIYWPQLKATHRGGSALLQQFLEAGFDIHRKRTLAIVGLALGSWIGGEQVSWALKNVAIQTPYPFAVFSPGSIHDEIIEMIRNADPYFEQFILFLCPSAVAHLHLKARETGRQLPLGKLRYVVLGEPFPEAVRMSLRSRAGVGQRDGFMYSIYGSADTGVLGVESSATVSLRQILWERPALAEVLGFDTPVPHLFHFVAQGAYVEDVGGELCVTRWQGVPLIRYNLHDRAALLDAPCLLRALEGSPHLTEADRKVLEPLGMDGPDPGLLAIQGRADGAIILCGTNITESMLDEAVRCPQLESYLTGAYQARTLYENDRQYLGLELEVRKEVSIDGALAETLYAQLVRSLGTAQPEFLDDWRNVYSAWDQHPDRRVMRLTLVPWPTMSSGAEARIKQRGVKP
jgi:phenylacetate-CoA ligase